MIAVNALEDTSHQTIVESDACSTLRKDIAVSDNITSQLEEPEKKLVAVDMIAEFDVVTSKLSDTEIKGLEDVLRCKDHLCKNIKDVNFDGVQSTGNRSSFKHLLSVILLVDTAGLWESARRYIHHHLGRGSWTFENGAKMKFTRIHQKK